MKILHCPIGMVTDDPRVLRARDSWDVLYQDFGWVKVPPLPDRAIRSRVAIGDPRNLPFVLDMLYWGTRASKDGDPMVVITADDVIFRPGIDAAVRALAEHCGLFTGQRIDVDNIEEAQIASSVTSDQPGRVLIGLTPAWLLTNRIPDFVAGASMVDLCLSAMARKLVGKPWTLATAHIHEPACEVAMGTLFHERHKPSWIDGQDTAPADLHNRKLAAKWFRENMPESMPENIRND